MISMSHKKNDFAFISKQIKADDLDPKPISGFLRAPNTWVDNADFKRVVEFYPWGAVLFVSDYKRNDHWSILVKGVFDLETGTVTNDGTQETINIEWYKELSKHVRGMLRLHVVNANRPVLPTCAGLYFHDSVCEGGIDLHNNLQEPCAWRAQCMVFRQHAERQGVSPEHLKGDKTQAEIEQMVEEIYLTKQAELAETKQAAKSGEVKNKVGTTNNNSAAKTANKERSMSTNKQTKVKPSDPNSPQMKLFWTFWESLEKALAPRKFVTDADTAQPGDVYFADRAVTSNYLTLYVKSHSGWPIGLAVVRLKQAESISVQTVVPDGHAIFAKFPKIKANTAGWVDGKFLTVTRPIPEEVTIPEMVDFIKQCDAAKLLGLPAVSTGEKPAPAPASGKPTPPAAKPNPSASPAPAAKPAAKAATPPAKPAATPEKKEAAPAPSPESKPAPGKPVPPKKPAPPAPAAKEVKAEEAKPAEKPAAPVPAAKKPAPAAKAGAKKADAKPAEAPVCDNCGKPIDDAANSVEAKFGGFSHINCPEEAREATEEEKAIARTWVDSKLMSEQEAQAQLEKVLSGEIEMPPAAPVPAAKKPAPPAKAPASKPAPAPAPKAEEKPAATPAKAAPKPAAKPSPAPAKEAPKAEEAKPEEKPSTPAPAPKVDQNKVDSTKEKKKPTPPKKG